MAKFIGILGVLALALAVVDLIHGPHNGDAHRVLIHVPEFISFLGLLCLLEIWGFNAVTSKFDTNRWLIVTCLSLLSSVLGLALFGLSGGSFHGDGGPIAASFLLLAAVGATVLPISFVVFIAMAISHKLKGIPILSK